MASKQDFAKAVAEGAAIDLGRGVHEGELHQDAVVRIPLAMMNRHGLGQLGSRVQHALRAFTPADAKALKATVSTYPKSDFYDLEALLTQMGIGEDAVTVLSERGVPTPVVHTRLVAPSASMGPAPDVEGAAKASPLYARYGERLDNGSAREILEERLAKPEPLPPTDAEAPMEHVPVPKRSRRAPKDPAPDAGVGDLLRSRQGKRIQREVIRGVFGMLRKRL